jgi:predicted CopG family antitoxin
MAVKTITIDVEAYEALKRRKREGQSFSQVIKEYFAGSHTGADLLRIGREAALEEETLDAIEEVIRSRRDDPVRDVDL